MNTKYKERERYKCMVKIPDWDIYGLLPPVRPGADFNSFDRSPYRTDILHLVEHFAMTGQRIKLLSSLLQYRQEWHNIGIFYGIQWINGSFVENAELRRKMPPRDIDVFTFFKIPKNETVTSLLSKSNDLFNHDEIKKKYNIDSYFQHFTETDNIALRKYLVYWYSMWSHTRVLTWKGFIEIGLDSSLDNEAANLLMQRQRRMKI